MVNSLNIISSKLRGLANFSNTLKATLLACCMITNSYDAAPPSLYLPPFYLPPPIYLTPPLYLTLPPGKKALIRLGRVLGLIPLKKERKIVIKI